MRYESDEDFGRPWRRLGRLGSTVLVAMVAALASVVVAACGSSSTGSTSTPSGQSATTGSGSTTGGGSTTSGTPVQVGFIDGLTGSDASTGQANLWQVKTAVNYINNTGGIDGHPLQLTPLDSGNVGSGQAGADATQLVQKKVSVIFGPTITNDCASVQPIVTNAKTPEVCWNLTTQQLAGPAPFIFDGTPPEVTTVKPDFEFIKQKLHLAGARLAILANFVGGATEFGDKVAKLAPAAGFNVVYHGSMSASATSVSTYCQQMVAAKPTMVIAETWPNFSGPLVQCLRAAHVNAPVIFTPGGIFYSTLLQMKDPNVYVPTGADMLVPGAPGQSATTKKIIAAAKQAGATTAAKINQNYGPTVIASTLWVLLQLRKCGPSCTGAELRQKIESGPSAVPGLSTSFGFTPTSHSGYNAIQLWGYNASSKTVAKAWQSTPGSTSLSTL